jgi:hypothetical protein
MVLGALAVLAAPAPAVADGAFPDSMRILLPGDSPQQIILGTNFGVIVSNDGGAHFHLICEEAIATAGENVTQYLLGPPPAFALYAMSINQLGVSADRGCSWTSAGGAWTDPTFTDVFPDPTDAARVFALALVRTGQGWFASSLFASQDGGHSFGMPLFQAPQSVLLTGVENAVSAPETIYLTEFGDRGDGVVSSLARSTNGGRLFDEVSLLETLGTGEVRLAAVDPTDPQLIYYRVLVPDGGDKLAISRDGGQTAQVALALGGPMTTFLRRSDGTLLVGTQLDGAFTSHDGGQTFTPWPEAPHLRALAERAGILYAATDNVVDGYAIGSSGDGGKTWTPLLHFEKLCGILDCAPGLAATCQASWSRLVALLSITGCAETPAPETQDAGARSSSDGAADASLPPAESAGCACRNAGTGTSGSQLSPSWLCWLIVAATIARRRPTAHFGSPV